MAKVQQANALKEDSKALAVTSVNKSAMEAAPTQESLATLRQLSDDGILPKELVTEAALIYFSLDPEAIGMLKLKHLVDAAKRVVAGEVMGEDFYLIPKLGVFTSQIGVQRELGANGLPPASWTFRLMTEEERANNELGDPEEYGVIATGHWAGLQLTAEGPGTCRLDDLYTNVYAWSQGTKSQKPRNQWKKKDPPKGRSFLWVAEKRAQKAAMQRVRGFVVATPSQRLEAARATGLQIDAPEGAVFSADQAQAAIDYAAVDAAKAAVEKDVRDLLGEDAYAQLLQARLKRNQAIMYGETDPFDDEEVKAIEGEAVPTNDAEDFFGVEPVKPELEPLSADFDILVSLRDSYKEIVSTNPNMTQPASDAQIKLWVQRLREAVEDTDDPVMAAALVTARLCNVSADDVTDAEFRPEDAQVRAWMRAWLIPAKPYDVTPEGKRQIMIVYGEAVKAFLAEGEDEGEGSPES